MKYLSLAWDVIKGIFKLLMVVKIYNAGKEREHLNEVEADLEAVRRAQAHRDKLRTDGSYSERLRSHFKR